MKKIKKLTPEMLVEKLQAEYCVEGQLELFQDPLLVLRSTPFKDLGKEENQKTIPCWIMDIYQPRSYYDGNFWWDKIPYELSETWENAVKENFSYISSGIGYRPETDQHVINFNFYEDIDVEICLKEFNCWLPYIKTWKYRADTNDKKDMKFDGQDHIVFYISGLRKCSFEISEIAEYFPGKSLIIFKEVIDTQFCGRVAEKIIRTFSSFEDFFKFAKQFKEINEHERVTP